MSFPAFRGLTAPVASRLVRMAERHGWDPVAIAAVIETESGWNPQAGLSVWRPNRTATGLLQFIESTARTIAQRMGVNPRVEFFSRDWVGKLSATEQLRLVEEFYLMTLGPGARRPVDYYAAAWGRGIGAPLERVLAQSGSDEPYQSGLTHAEVYDQNAGLDRDGDGAITMADLDSFVRSKIASAQSRGSLTVGSQGGSERPPGFPVFLVLLGFGLAAASARAKVKRLWR